MASKKRPAKAPVSAAPSFWERLVQPRFIFAGFALAVLLFYGQPLFSSAASIQWDAVDVTYSAQKYLSELLHSGKLPFWTPYTYSGMPLMADPQLGAWYPLNWPFFLIGITPHSIEAQLALHALIAALGAYLLSRDLFGSRAGAVLAGLFFALSGLFAETSSHIGPFQATAWLPALLWTGRRAARSHRWLAPLAIVSGLLVLTGHFQTALYSFFALAVFLTADTLLTRGDWLRTATAVVCAAVAAATLPAVMVLPGLELSGQSIRAGSDYSHDAGAALVPGALATLVLPDHYGALEVEGYSGPPDITQFYLYMGILMIPLAIAGAFSGERWRALALIVPGAWYAFGPPAGFYSVIALLPGFRSVRAPIQMWFVAALGLALLAGMGAAKLRARWNSPWLAVGLILFTGIDLYYWNISRNQLAFARSSFQEIYGAPQDRFRAAVAPVAQQPIHRIYAPTNSPSFGPLNGSLDSRIEVTFGYNPLELSRYAKYMEAAAANPRLLNGLGVTASINMQHGAIQSNPNVLPRIYAPDNVTPVRSREEAAALLANLDPARETVVEGSAPASGSNGGVEVRIRAYDGDLYRARVDAPHPAVLRIAVPYFPGWRAKVDGKPVAIMPADLALMGISIPAGSHDLVISYRSTWFGTGLAISLAAWLMALMGLKWLPGTSKMEPQH
jgi:hypothetical protein